MSGAAGGRGRGEGVGRDDQPAPLDVFTSQVMYARMNLEAVEDLLEHMPRWRFRRRAELKREVDRRRRRENELSDLLRGT